MSMESQEFKRELDELRAVISDGIAYFFAGRALCVDDDEPAQALNRYRFFFLPARNTLLSMALLEFAKVFDRDPRTVGLSNLLNAAKENQAELLSVVATEADLESIGQQIERSEELLGRLKTRRDQRIAHHDANPSENMKLFFGEMQRLIDKVKCMYNRPRVAHVGEETSFEYLTRRAQDQTSRVVRIMREEMDRDADRIREADAKANLPRGE